MKSNNLLKIILLNFMLSVPLYSGWTDDQINVGSISFKDALWDNIYNVIYSKQKVSDLTANNKAVVLFLFEACFS